MDLLPQPTTAIVATVLAIGIAAWLVSRSRRPISSAPVVMTTFSRKRDQQESRTHHKTVVKMADALPEPPKSTTGVPDVDTVPVTSASPRASPIPEPAAVEHMPSLLTDSESATAARLHANWGRPPSDRPDALLVCDRPDAKCWRRKGAKGAHDEYESEIWLPVRPETLLAMLCDVRERVQWDDTTARLDVLSTSGTARLRALHEQSGDDMMLSWLVTMPWPLASREYILRRRVCLLSDGTADGSGVVYSKVDTADDGPGSRMLAPTVTPKSKRVPEHVNIQAIWAESSARGGTCFRALVREDPMMTLPKWLLSWLLDKLMPSSLASMVTTAVAYEKRLEEKAQGAAGAARA